jgi:ribonuclease Z
MSWLVQPRPVNGPFDDPGVYLDFRYGRRAILFDLGDLAPLSSREILRVSHAFVSHAHIDHFAGFDRLFRVCLHRPGPLHLLGPPGFIDQVEHKVRAFTWNLIGEDAVDFGLHVGEFHDSRIARAAIFRARDRFVRQEQPDTDVALKLLDGVVLADEAFRVEAVALDHGIPSLAFALRETLRVNVCRGALERLSLPVGPWLNEAKRAVRTGAPEDTAVEVPGHGVVRIAELVGKVLRVGAGQAIAYVTDAAFTGSNATKIVELARHADQLFIEAVFLDEEAHLAEATRHLTASQAGWLAHEAGVRHVMPFHHSARYLGRADALREEVAKGFRGLHAESGQDR